MPIKIAKQDGSMFEVGKVRVVKADGAMQDVKEVYRVQEDGTKALVWNAEAVLYTGGTFPNPGLFSGFNNNGSRGNYSYTNSGGRLNFVCTDRSGPDDSYINYVGWPNAAGYSRARITWGKSGNFVPATGFALCNMFGTEVNIQTAAPGTTTVNISQHAINYYALQNQNDWSCTFYITNITLF